MKIFLEQKVQWNEIKYQSKGMEEKQLESLKETKQRSSRLNEQEWE